MNQSGSRWKGLLRRWGPLLITAVSVALIFAFLQRTDMFDSIDFQSLHWGYFVLVVLSRVGAYFLLGLSFARYTAHLGAPLPFAEWFGLTVSGAMTNVLSPIGGGGVVRGGYMRVKYSLPLSRFVALLAATSLIGYLVSGSMGLILLGNLVLLDRQDVVMIVPILIIVMTVGPLLALQLPLERIPLPSKNRVLRWVHLALDGWNEIRESPQLLLEQILITSGLQILQAFSLYWAIRVIGEQPPLANTLFLGVLLGAWRVTPVMGIGVRELVAFIGAPLVAIDPAHGLMGALISRLANWVCLFTLGPFFSYLLSKRLGEPLSHFARRQSSLLEQEKTHL